MKFYVECNESLSGHSVTIYSDNGKQNVLYCGDYDPNVAKKWARKIAKLFGAELTFNGKKQNKTV